MRRRPLMALAITAFSGCSLGDAARESTLPDECPVDTIESEDPPPDDLDLETTRSYVEAYEEAYIEQTKIDREKYERVTGPGSNVVDVDRLDGGYLVDVETGWAVWYPDRDALEFEALDEPPDDPEPVPADHDAFEGDAVLRDHLEEAIEGEHSVLDEEERGYEETYDRIADVAGEVDGAIIAVDDRFVEVTRVDVPGAHGDGFARSKYYVAPRELRRSNHDDDPRYGDLLEC